MSYPLPQFNIFAGQTLVIQLCDKNQVPAATNNPIKGVVIVNGSPWYLTVAGGVSTVTIPPGINDLIVLPATSTRPQISIQVGTDGHFPIETPEIQGTVYEATDTLPVNNYPCTNPSGSVFAEQNTVIGSFAVPPAGLSTTVQIPLWANTIEVITNFPIPVGVQFTLTGTTSGFPNGPATNGTGGLNGHIICDIPPGVDTSAQLVIGNPVAGGHVYVIAHATPAFVSTITTPGIISLTDPSPREGHLGIGSAGVGISVPSGVTTTVITGGGGTMTEVVNLSAFGRNSTGGAGTVLRFINDITNKSYMGTVSKTDGGGAVIDFQFHGVLFVPGGADVQCVHNLGVNVEVGAAYRQYLPSGP